MICYDNLWLLMKKNKMTKTQLRLAAGLSTSTFAKLTKNEIVSLDVLIRVCEVFKCQISDICVIDYRRKVK
jgi:DNA-binding Xre family transcriptional regulator